MDCEVFEAFHEADAASVVEVVEVLERLLFFSIRFIIISVLLESLSNHILTDGCGFLQRDRSELARISGQLSKGVITIFSLVNIKQVSFNGWVTLTSTVSKSLNHAFVSTFKHFRQISELAVFEFEDFVRNEVFESLMWVKTKPSLNKIEAFRIKLARSSQFTLIKPFLNKGVFRVVFDICFEVVTVLLFFFSQASEEVSVVINLALVTAVKHPFLTAFVVVGV